MRTLHLALALALSLPASAALAADPAATCPAVLPGEALGPVRLGMTLAELEGLGLEVRPAHHPNAREVGPYRVTLTEGRITTVGLESDDDGGDCVRIDDADVVLAEVPLAELAAHWPGQCGPLQMNIGANVIDCAHGVTVLAHRAGKAVRVTAERAAVPIRCDAYVAANAAARPRVRTADVPAGARVCFQTRVLTSDLTPDDVTKVTSPQHISTCVRTDGVGGTMLECHFQGVRLIFGGPGPSLRRVESIPIRQ